LENCWAAIVRTAARIGHGPRTIRYNPVLVSVDNRIGAIISSADYRELGIGRRATQPQAAPVQIRVWRRSSVTRINDVGFFNVPGVVTVPYGYRVHAGFSRICVKHHHRLTHTGTCLTGTNGIGINTAARAAAREPGSVQVILHVVPNVLKTRPSNRRPVLDGRGSSCSGVKVNRIKIGRACGACGISANVVFNIRIGCDRNSSRRQGDRQRRPAISSRYGVIQTHTIGYGLLQLRITRRWISRWTIGVGDLRLSYDGEEKEK
jgi:hypothetical protein